MSEYGLPGPGIPQTGTLYVPGCDEYRGLGPGVLRLLMDEKLVINPVDIYHLDQKREQLVTLEKLGEKSVDNLLAGSKPLKNGNYRG